MRVILAAVLSLCSVLPALSQPLPDCAAPGYLGEFPGGPTDVEFLCEEIFRFTVMTPGGERTIRGIRNFGSEWIVPPGAAAELEQGARDAAAALARLGNYRMDHITFLLADEPFRFARTPEEADAPEVAATTDGREGQRHRARGECLITLFGGGRFTLYESAVRVTAAHEIFHCVQYASLSAGQMGTVGTNGDWWIEGTAEYFSAVAVPDSFAETDRGARFSEAVAEGRALYEMRHEMGVFFSWWLGSDGLGQLMPFMRNMPADSSPAAQRAAMRATLGDDLWLDFAEAFADEDIHHPQGSSFSLTADFTADSRNITGNQDETITLDPFVLTLGQFTYDCGTWRTTLNPVNPNLSAARDGEPFGPWPDEFDATEGNDPVLRFVGLHTGDSPEAVQLDIERRRACGPCQGSDVVQACIAGVWEMTGGGPVEWMRANGIPITAHAESPRYITYWSDGTYLTAPIGIEMTLTQGDSTAEGSEVVSAAAGRWSASDGQLNICVDSSVISGVATITTPRGSGTLVINENGAGDISMSYSCSEGGQMTTSQPIPGYGPIRSTFTRIAEEPPRP